MKKYALILLAILAATMARRALRHEAELVKLLWALLGLVAIAGTTDTPKTRAVEQRLNALVPKVFPNTGGTINGNVQVNGSHTVSGTVSANTLQGTLSAGYVSGTVSSANTANTANTATTANTANTANSVSGLSIPVGRAGGLTSAPSSYTQAWGNSVVSFCTAVNNQLQSAGVFN